MEIQSDYLAVSVQGWHYKDIYKLQEVPEALL